MNHGTDEGWVNGCRCDACHKAHKTRATSVYRLRVLRGERWTDTQQDWEPVKKHIQILLDLGHTQATVAREAGVKLNRINAYMYQDYKKTVKPDFGKAILDVPLLPPKTDTRGLNPEDLVNGVGAQRRLKALCVIGFSVSEVCREIGIHKQALNIFLRGPENKFIRAKTVDRINQAFSEMILRPRPEGPAAERTRNRARKNDWHGYLAWPNIDDPMSEPETKNSLRRERRRK